MWTSKLGSGWGGLPPNNSHSFEIAENVKEYGEFFGIDFNAHRPSDKLSWKLEDATGCQHNLPFLFKAGELSKFNIIVDGFAGMGEYHFTCSLCIWPKEFPSPIAKFYSLTTVQIRGPELKTFNDGRKYSQSTPNLRRRRKGDVEWKDSTFLITFSGCEEIFEVQFYTPLPNSTMIYSPIVEVGCMWREFDFERDWQLDLEEMNLHRKLSFVYDKDKFYKTKCTILLKKIDTTASDDNKEVSVGWIDSDRVKMEKTSLVPGALYELKMNESSISISFIRIFLVSDDLIDNALWTNLFGSTDHVTFMCEESLTRCSLKSALAPADTVDDMKSEKRHLTLYKHGYFHYKSTLHWQPQPYHPLENFNFSGTFTLCRDDSSIVQIKLSKVFKSKTSTKPNISLLPPDPTDEGTITEPLLIPELLDRILSYESDSTKLTCRLVWIQQQPQEQ